MAEKKDLFKHIAWDGEVNIEWEYSSANAWHNDQEAVRQKLNLFSHSEPGRSYFGDPFPFYCELLDSDVDADYRTYRMTNSTDKYHYDIRVDKDPVEGLDLSLNNDDDVLKFCDTVIFDRVKSLWLTKKLPESMTVYQFEGKGLIRI